MTRLRAVLSLLLFLVFVNVELSAIPEVVGFGGGVVNAAPVQEDVDVAFLNEALWANAELPGEWVAVPGFRPDERRRRTTNPRLFGVHTELIEATATKGRLEALSVSYLDRIRFFEMARLEAMKRGTQVEEASTRWKQTTERAFNQRFEETEEILREALKKTAGRSPEKSEVGETRLLKTEFEDYRIGKLRVRLVAEEEVAIALVIVRDEEAKDHYRLAGDEDLSRRDLEKELKSRVVRDPIGDVRLEGVPVYLQGNRPDCGICTLGMVTHYFGLRFGTQGMAAGARIRASGMRRGEGILEIYKAFTEEAGVRSASAPSFDFERAQEAIEKGCPVIVFRRYSEQRNTLHNRFAKAHAKDREAELPEADVKDQASWPGKDAPAHASVITGFNKDRGEVIFMESWGEHVRDRRMRFEELEATSYKAFYFKP